MTHQIDLSTALSVLTKILTSELNVLNDEPPTDPPPPILNLIGATIFGFQSRFRIKLRVLITVPFSSSPDSSSNSDSNSEAQNNHPEPQIVWECPALASTSSFSTVTEVDEFMKTLEKVNVTSLKQDARECDICKTDFSHLPAAAASSSFTNPTPASHGQEPANKQSFKDEELESPVRLACGHVYGEKCLKTWISGKGIGTLPTCPMCRAVLDRGSIAVSEIRITLDRAGALSYMH